MQRRLHLLQNPKDCSSARKLVCSFDVFCGFSCQVHHAMYCFMVAYATERTLILQSQGMCLKGVHMCGLRYKELGVVCMKCMGVNRFAAVNAALDMFDYVFLTFIIFWSTSV